MKNVKLKFLSFVFVIAFALAGAVGCKNGNPETDGSYMFREAEGDKTYSVLFELSNPSPVGSGLSETTAYLRLVNVYLNFRKIESTQGLGKIKIERCVKQENNKEPFGPQFSYRGTVPAKGSSYGKWLSPCDFSVTDWTILEIESYKYYRISSEGGRIYVDEIVFVGEILDRKDGKSTPTGEYCIVPVKIHTATTQGGETQERANQRAKALIDDQPQSVTEIIK